LQLDCKDELINVVEEKSLLIDKMTQKQAMRSVVKIRTF
jgi:hypothetical protein